MSNVTEKIGKSNEQLLQWIEENKENVLVHEIKYNYRSSSYNKIIRDAKEKEVLIVNRGYDNEIK